MNMLAALLVGLPAIAVAQEKQDRTEGETREVRVYVIDRATPDRDFKDAGAVLTISRANGRGRTFLLPRVAKPAPMAGDARGLIRGLAGSPYFVELITGDAAPADDSPGHEEKGKAARDVLRRVHQGACFSQKIPASLVSEPFTATITIRLGDFTLTSEEFAGPRSRNDELDEVATRVDRALAQVRERAEQDAGFMDLRPAAVELIRELARLAPAGFEDLSGAFERNRQWCLAQARAIERLCADGDTNRIAELARMCGPRLKEMQNSLAREKKIPPAPEPEVK